ncbi:sulfite oxidase-like [Asterias amurensis]|uniref:sulfite oxidase-like n=1 Tax=Asterias amurensis TaxID=7602 RepID=UPI003AB59E80
MSQLLLLGSRVAVGCCRLTRRNLLPTRDSKRFELVVATSTKCNANFEGKQRGFHGHGGAAGEDSSDPGKWGTSSGLLMVGAAAVIGGIGLSALVNSSKCAEKKQAAQSAGKVIKGLPEYNHDDVEKHNSPETGIWMTYKNGVYDVTSFVAHHPGGDKIMLAGGGSLEPFWALYAVHQSDETLALLETLRIGNYKDDERIQKKDVNDPFASEPHRHPALTVNSKKPFNAEPPPELLIDSFITPNELFFVRNHLPVPVFDKKNFKLNVEVPGKKTIKLSVDELKKYKEHTITGTMQCAGNRRSQMSNYKTVKGLSWKFGAISTAEWTGVMLRDVLLKAGLTEEDEAKFAYVQFEGLDKDPNGGSYGSSIPLSVAMNPYRDVLLAYKMNGQDIPADHGHPLRVIIPGNIGARSVKWLSKVIVSDKESPSHWQQKDYKSFNPSVEFGQLNYDTAPPVQEYPVQSAICYPKEGSSVDVDEEKVTVKGYAWSGGGRGILRVDVSVDGGQKWHVAELKDAGQKIQRVWAWTQWEAEIPIPKDHKGKLDIYCKAIDSSHNVQPDTMKGIWNVRGLMNTAWHRVNVKVVE